MIDTEYHSGNRQEWAKLVTGVDETKSNGYSLIGRFLTTNIELELPVGSIIVKCVPTGSVKHSGKQGELYKLTEDGLELLYKADWKKNFLSFRDEIVKSINEKINPLAPYSDEELLNELKRRNLITE